MTERTRNGGFPIIDCDIHNAPASIKALHPYLSVRWRKHSELFGIPMYRGTNIPRGVPYASRRDSWPPSGQPPGSDLRFLQDQLLDYWGIQFGILNCISIFDILNLEYAAALVRAINDWQIDEWLEPEPRLRASIVVAGEDGELAAGEIERLGAHAKFVQVLLIVHTNEPLGRRKYWKIYETALRHNLPIAIHFGGAGPGQLSAAGNLSHYIEYHTGMTQAFQTQVASLVCEGVFEQFPTLKIVLTEGGFAWLPPLMWRLDCSWKKLRDEIPYLKRLPSAYIREHFWCTTQPMAEPPKQEHFEQTLECFDADSKLMFATDYPHWDFDPPDRALGTNVRAERRRKIMADNARALYRL